MPTLASTPVSDRTNGLAYGVSYASAFSIEFEPQVWKEWYQAYGKGLGIFDVATLLGQTVGVRSNTITSFTDVAFEKPVKIDTEIATAIAGATSSISLDASELVEGSTTVKPVVEVGSSFYVDPVYTNSDIPQEAYLVTMSSTTGDGTFKFYDATVTISTAIPADSYLMVGPWKTARGGGQPAPKSSGTTSSTFVTGISGATGTIEGGLNAIKSYRETVDRAGNPVLFSKMQVETEFDLNAKMNHDLLLSQLNTNSLTSTIYGSSTGATRSTKGLLPHIESDGMELEYASSFSVDHFDVIKDYLRSQAVTDTDVVHLVGSGLLKNIENNMLGYIKEYSGGSDLMSDLGNVGAKFDSFTKNGLTNHIIEMSSWDNPQTYGNMDDYFRNLGFVIPISLATLKPDPNIMVEPVGNKIKIPNLSLGYLKGNGEDRERMVKIVSGVNGYGYPAVDEYDRVNFYIKSEYMLIANLVNQMIKVHKTGTF